MTERRPKMSWSWRWFWPEIHDIESAKAATLYGVIGAACISVTTAVITTISLVARKPILGLDVDAWAYIDTLIMAIVAWRIKNFSRLFAVGVIAFFLISKFILMPWSQGAISMVFILSIFLINGARGVFAYNRFKPTSVWGEFPRARERSQLGGNAPNVATTSRDSATEDKLYEQALTEVDSGQTVKALWARAFADAEGDEAKTKALYIRFRVENLKLLAAVRPTKPETKPNGQDVRIGPSGEKFISSEARESAIARPPSEPVNAFTARAFTGREKMLVIIFVAVVVLLFLTGIYLKQKENESIAVVPAPSSAAAPPRPPKSMYDGLVELAPVARQAPPREATGVVECIPSEKLRCVPAPTPDKLKAAAQGDPAAQYWVGLGYLFRGTPEDDKQAAFWLEKAATQGIALAQHELATMYYLGTGVTQDYKRAAFWFQQAAEDGLEDSQNQWGLMYHLGRGVPQDDVEAHKWWNLAGRNGDEIPRNRRERIEKLMTAEQITEAQRRASEWLKAHK